jgi:biopolymer transport protein ExbD
MSASVWQVRHEGSPQAREGLTAEEVLEGVQEGLWDPTDEVRGPGDAHWEALERHPHFADALADYEPFGKPEPEDETRLDMNPLIDVALVLLVFFMLTTAYEMLRKTLPLPAASKLDPKKPPIPLKQLENTTVLVKAEKDADGNVVVKVEDTVVPLEKLTAAIRERSQPTPGRQLRTSLLIDARDVPWGVVVAIMDSAAEAKIEQTMFAVPVKAGGAKADD